MRTSQHTGAGIVPMRSLCTVVQPVSRVGDHTQGYNCHNWTEEEDRVVLRVARALEIPGLQHLDLAGLPGGFSCPKT